MVYITLRNYLISIVSVTTQLDRPGLFLAHLRHHSFMLYEIIAAAIKTNTVAVKIEREYFIF